MAYIHCILDTGGNVVPVAKQAHALVSPPGVAIRCHVVYTFVWGKQLLRDISVCRPPPKVDGERQMGLEANRTDARYTKRVATSPLPADRYWRLAPRDRLLVGA